MAHTPIEITHFGSDIWSYNRRSGTAIFQVTVPATIIRSDWRGVARKASIPKREISNLDIAVAIISNAQQASPNCIGNSEDLRAQFSKVSTEVTMMLRSLLSAASRVGVEYGRRRVAFMWFTSLPSSSSLCQVSPGKRRQIFRKLVNFCCGHISIPKFFFARRIQTLVLLQTRKPTLLPVRGLQILATGYCIGRPTDIAESFPHQISQTVAHSSNSAR